MFAKLEGLEKKYMELEQALAQPDVYNDQDQYRKLTKAHADLRDVVELFRRHRSLTQELEENKQLLHDSDPDIKAMAQEEIAAAEAAKSRAAAAKELRGKPGATKDGHLIPLLANVGKPADAAKALEYGAEGVGLFRTEFLFIGNSEPPTVQEQPSP